jgi:hypothetical protein
MNPQKEKPQNYNNIDTANSNLNLTEGAKYLIKKNMKGILEIVLEDVNNFKQPLNLKIKSLSVLNNLIKACGSSLENYVDKILNSIYNKFEEDEEFNKQLENVANMLGLTIDQSIIIPILLKHIQEIESKNSFQPLLSRLKILSYILQKVTNITNESVTLILKTLKVLDLFNIPENIFSKNILISLYFIYDSIISNLQKECKNFRKEFLLPLLLLQSLPETKQIHEAVKKTILKLAENNGFTSVEDLYSLELEDILSHFNETHITWNKSSPDRFAFDTYIKNGGAALEKHWYEILVIISQTTEPVKDLEMKMDMICLLDFLIDNQEVNYQLKSFMDYIIPEILLPSCAWKSQRPSYKVRKAALVCLIKIFKGNLCEKETSIGLFTEFFNVLKQALDDDWDPEIRFLAINLLREYFIFNGEEFSEENLREYYPVLLKRLDDSQDANRIAVCIIITIFFKCCKRVKMSDTILDYVLNTSFIHLDDPNEKVREAIFGFLKDSINVCKDILLKIANRNMNIFTHKSMIDRLLEIANNSA